MLKTVIDQQEVLIITRNELEEQVKMYALRETKARNLKNDAEVKMKSAREVHDIILAKAEKISHQFSETKAKGFKEAFEGLLAYFTGKVVNVNDEGELI